MPGDRRESEHQHAQVLLWEHLVRRKCCSFLPQTRPTSSTNEKTTANQESSVIIMSTLNTKQLSALADTDPQAFVKAFEEARNMRNARRRRRYSQNINNLRDKSHAINRAYREAHLEQERERARRYAEQKKHLRDLYKRLTQEAA